MVRTPRQHNVLTDFENADADVWKTENCRAIMRSDGRIIIWKRNIFFSKSM